MIGYYIHRHGLGHLAMARCIAPRLTQRVTGLSSRARPRDWPGPLTAGLAVAARYRERSEPCAVRS